ncbi:hypothetical protein H7Y40_00540 [Pedobacter sp.]|nr:hypothetical protein [Candidatus Saccharibacteria bacterium]
MNTYTLESMLTVLLLGVAVAVVHMMFQLGVSVLTLLSGHSLGAHKAHLRLLHLNASYIIGVYTTIVLVTLGLLTLTNVIGLSDHVLWLLTTVVAAVVGCAVCLVYYRRGKGTVLWLPRSIAEYLSKRAKKTKHGVEAAALGGMTVIAELPFLIAPLLIVSLLLKTESQQYQLGALLAYAFLVVIPLLVVTTLIGAGHRLSTIQRWREDNKSFLQYSGGLGLIVIALYLTVFRIVGVSL